MDGSGRPELDQLSESEEDMLKRRLVALDKENAAIQSERQLIQDRIRGIETQREKEEQRRKHAVATAERRRKERERATAEQEEQERRERVAAREQEEARKRAAKANQRRHDTWLFFTHATPYAGSL